METKYELDSWMGQKLAPDWSSPRESSSIVQLWWFIAIRLVKGFPSAVVPHEYELK